MADTLITTNYVLGLTLEQVNELYGLIDKAWKSKEFRPQINFREAQQEGETGMSMRQMSIAQEERRKSHIDEKEVAAAN